MALNSLFSNVTVQRPIVFPVDCASRWHENRQAKGRDRGKKILRTSRPRRHRVLDVCNSQILYYRKVSETFFFVSLFSLKEEKTETFWVILEIRKILIRPEILWQREIINEKIWKTLERTILIFDIYPSFFFSLSIVSYRFLFSYSDSEC